MKSKTKCPFLMYRLFLEDKTFTTSVFNNPASSRAYTHFDTFFTILVALNGPIWCTFTQSQAKPKLSFP